VIICFSSFKWACIKRYYWHSKVCFLPWPLPWNRQQTED